MMGHNKAILLLIPQLVNGGSERQCLLLANGLASGGWTVHIGFWQGDPAAESLLKSSGVILHELRGSWASDPRIFLAIARLIARHRPVVVHTWLRQMDIFGGGAALLCRTKWVVAERSGQEAYTTWRDRLRRRLGRRADLVIANSLAGADYWRTSGKTPPLHIIPNGLQAAEIARTPAFVIPDWSGPLVVSVGRLIPSKHPLELIRSLSDGLGKGRFRLALLGEGPLDVHLRSAAHDLGVADAIYMPGRVSPEAVWSWLRRAQAFVSLSDFEGHPNAVIEAMAAGCPVIASDIPEHRAILTDSAAAFIDHRNPATIAAAVDAMLGADPAALAQRVVAARSLCEQWSVDGMVEAYENHYRSTATEADACAE